MQHMTLNAIMAASTKAPTSATAMAQTGGVLKPLEEDGVHSPVLLDRVVPGAQPHEGVPPEPMLHWNGEEHVNPRHALGVVGVVVACVVDVGVVVDIAMDAVVDT